MKEILLTVKHKYLQSSNSCDSKLLFHKFEKTTKFHMSYNKIRRKLMQSGQFDMLLYTL